MNVAPQAPERTEETTACKRRCHCNPSTFHPMSCHRYVRDKLLVVAVCAIVTLLLCIYPVHSFTTQPCCYSNPSPSHFVISRQCSNSQVVLSLALLCNNNNNHHDESDHLSPPRAEFFIRRALPTDMGTASQILADCFFGDCNFFKYQLEKLRTYLSLESDFPKKYDPHEMFVACRNTDGRVVAVCDVDNRPASNEPQRPYMCNLAVCPEWRNMGLAKALITKCEEQVLEWNCTQLHLKARQRNGAAVALYKSLGYEVQSESYDREYMDYLVVMKKDILRDMQTTNVTYMRKTETQQNDERF